MLPLAITAYSVVCATGYGHQALLAALRERRGPLRPNDFTAQPLPTWIGRVPDLESRAGICRRAGPLGVPQQPPRLGGTQHRWFHAGRDGRASALRRTAHRTGPGHLHCSDRCHRGVLSSPGRPGGHARAPVCTRAAHAALARRLRPARAGAGGPCFTIATACSSSAKVFCQAERLMRLGLCDAVVVGGVDSLCNSVLYGFGSLELLSPDTCRPFAVDRRGLNIGEAAAFVLLERGDRSDLKLLGYGESSDAHHMSAPHPDGLGARLAVEQALARAGAARRRSSTSICTARRRPRMTRSKRRSWRAVSGHDAGQFHQGLDRPHAGRRGQPRGDHHVAGTAHGLIPGTLNTTQLDPQVRSADPARQCASDLRFALSNSFGFGGSNCVLLFGRDAA